jgi:hypothetical protein
MASKNVSSDQRKYIMSVVHDKARNAKVAKIELRKKGHALFLEFEVAKKKYEKPLQDAQAKVDALHSEMDKALGLVYDKMAKAFSLSDGQRRCSPVTSAESKIGEQEWQKIQPLVTEVERAVMLSGAEGLEAALVKFEEALKKA